MIPKGLAARRGRFRFLALASAALALAAADTARAILARRPAPPDLGSRALALGPDVSRALSLGFSSVVADVNWIRFLQEIPLSPADAREGTRFATHLRTVVALDPSFHSAYLDGGVLLAVMGNQPCSALDVGEQGVQRFPLDWRLSFQAGYTCFADLGDTQCAERNMRRAADLPGAPKWLPGLVARFLAANGRSEAALQYLQMQLAETRDPRLHAEFEQRLAETKLTIMLERLESAVRRYRVDHDGQVPDSLQQLVALRYVDAIPAEDPLGGTFLLRRDGHVASSSGRGRLAPIRNEGGLDRLIEHLTPERVATRTTGLLGHPAWLFFATDAVATEARLGVWSLQGGSLVLSLAGEGENAFTDRDLQNLVILMGRVIITADLDRLRLAQLRLLRKNPGRVPSLEEIIASAGVPDHDPFGDAWILGENGRVSERPNAHHPLVPVHGHGAVACQ